MFHLCADEYSGGEISRGGEEKKKTLRIHFVQGERKKKKTVTALVYI